MPASPYEENDASTDGERDGDTGRCFLFLLNQCYPFLLLYILHYTDSFSYFTAS